MPKTIKYLIKDGVSGRQIYTSYARWPKPFARRRTKECDTPWCTNSNLWYGDLNRAVARLSEVYGAAVELVPDGEVEFFNV